MLVNGTIGDAAISSTGEGDIYVVGTTTSVAVNSSGDGNIELRNANGKIHHISCVGLDPCPLQPFTSLGFLSGSSHTKVLVLQSML